MKRLATSISLALICVMGVLCFANNAHADIWAGEPPPGAALVTNLAIALAFTIVIEVGVGVAFGYWRWRQIATIALINVITNPPFNFFLTFNYHYQWIPNSVAVLGLEVVIVLVEWRLYVFAWRKRPWRLLALSAAMNASSFLAGILFSSAGAWFLKK